MEIFKLFIHRENVGTHKQPILCATPAECMSLTFHSRAQRLKFIKEKGYDYDGEISASIERIEVDPIHVGDWFKTPEGSYIYVVSCDRNGIRAFGYRFKKKELPDVIPENVRMFWFDATLLTKSGKMTKCPDDER